MQPQKFRDALKNKLGSKRHFMICPLGFALAACGGGGGTVIFGQISTMNSFGLTDNPFKNATTQGSYWTPSDNILTYAVANGFNGETEQPHLTGPC